MDLPNNSSGVQWGGGQDPRLGVLPPIITAPESNISLVESMTVDVQVECSLQSGFVKGMLVLVANRSPVGTYWPASIVMPCGQLLRLRPIGCHDDASRDFWCDVTSADVRPISSCRDRRPQDVRPPDGMLTLFAVEFLARDVIYTSLAYATMSVSVCLSVT